VPGLNLGALSQMSSTGGALSARKTVRVEDSDMAGSSLFQGLELYAVQTAGK
jgi:hypothetical protein